ncbi:mitochondrial thiamine pyrophosphate carrier [Brachionus plicatilis]|uniref:Mitochondrial thiamine pyrophosphate carrier n=1 Tax=Brachionus plicatilis TaxID=10195 RepID=A0A3M7SMY3_BRAPC|nr:mitochondrial thiamine pyrophosphate carrier [Brachionus plicatilis]
MVGYDPKKINLSTREQACATTGSAVLTRALIQPFDVLKIRYQVQYEPISKKSQLSKYKSLGQSLSTIIKEEGVLALWKGHLTGQLLSISFSAHLLWFEVLTRYAFTLQPSLAETENKKFLAHFACGGVGASLTLVTNQPIDTIRTRLVTQGEPRVYNGILDAVNKVYTNEGLRGFYRGTVPNLMLITPETAFKLGFYQLLNSLWDYAKRIDSSERTKNISAFQSSINGSIAGIISKTIAYPFDLSKKRLQIQGFEDARKKFGKVVKFSGLWNCLYISVKNEGLLGIYKGYLPSVLKAALSSGLTFFFYEQLTNLIRSLNY